MIQLREIHETQCGHDEFIRPKVQATSRVVPISRSNRLTVLTHHLHFLQEFVAIKTRDELLRVRRVHNDAQSILHDVVATRPRQLGDLFPFARQLLQRAIAVRSLQ
ncbi:hypothetical protein WT07_01420 [Burkholderia stagnalis]|nr:hypothetical protein WT07_01420 [Burkholderia stagnalis]KWE12050.1 hypothetical protein WT47_05945 [Burkholderia stagnalis]KWE20888.1 hypothetical protein WT48_09115 [Burkholderia stagnalis]KWO72659.1 hypothetical protein WU00_15300 [Burkholderia stagnalis]